MANDADFISKSIPPLMHHRPPRKKETVFPKILCLKSTPPVVSRGQGLQQDVTTWYLVHPSYNFVLSQQLLDGKGLTLPRGGNEYHQLHMEYRQVRTVHVFIGYKDVAAHSWFMLSR